MGAQFLIVFLKLTLATINYTENQPKYFTPKLNIPLRKDDSIFIPIIRDSSVEDKSGSRV